MYRSSVWRACPLHHLTISDPSLRSAMSTERVILVLRICLFLLLLALDDIQCVTSTETEFCEKYVRSKGYLCEEHKTQTDDGFVITLHRVGVKQSSSPSVTEQPENKDVEAQNSANLKVAIGFSKKDVSSRSRNVAREDLKQNAWTSMDHNVHVDFLSRRPYEMMVQLDASQFARPKPFETYDPGYAYPHRYPRESSSWPQGDAKDSPENRPLFVLPFPLRGPPTAERPATPVPETRMTPPTSSGDIPTSAETPVTLFDSNSSSVYLAPQAQVPGSSQSPLASTSVVTQAPSVIDTPSSGTIASQSPSFAPSPTYLTQATISDTPISSPIAVDSNSKSELTPSPLTQSPVSELPYFVSPARLTSEPATASQDPMNQIPIPLSPDSTPLPFSLTLPPNSNILSPTVATAVQTPSTSQNLPTQATTFLGPEVSPSDQLSSPGLPEISNPVGVPVPSPVTIVKWFQGPASASSSGQSPTTRTAMAPEASSNTIVGVQTPGQKPYMGNSQGSPVSKGSKSEPVLLLHQELLNGDSWFKHVDDEAQSPLFPFMLADEGFDVWIAHERATYWSHDHIELGLSNQRYWNWTWDDHAKYDLPSMLRYANSMTNSKVHIVGVSQSAAVGAAAATETDTAALMRSLTLIGPTIYHGTAALPPMRAWADILARMVDGPDFGPVTGRFNLSREFNFRSLSLRGPATAISGAISGPDCCISSSVTLYDNGWDGTTSFKNFEHFEQGILRNTFKHFDYGSTARNLEAYGQLTPPPYSPRDIPADLPVLIIYGGQDYFSPPDGIMELVNVMKKRPQTGYLASYGHFDLFFSSRRHTDVYHPIRRFLRGEYGLESGSSVPSAV